jgi:hypothetical protein
LGTASLRAGSLESKSRSDPSTERSVGKNKTDVSRANDAAKWTDLPEIPDIRTLAEKSTSFETKLKWGRPKSRDEVEAESQNDIEPTLKVVWHKNNPEYEGLEDFRFIHECSIPNDETKQAVQTSATEAKYRELATTIESSRMRSEEIKIPIVFAWQSERRPGNDATFGDVLITDDGKKSPADLDTSVKGHNNELIK